MGFLFSGTHCIAVDVGWSVAKSCGPWNYFHSFDAIQMKVGKRDDPEI